MDQRPVFVIVGHHIEWYGDAVTAAREIDKSDVDRLECFGVDGTVYLAKLDDPASGSVSLEATDANRLDRLTELLRTEAAYRGIRLPRTYALNPIAVWRTLLAAEEYRDSAP